MLMILTPKFLQKPKKKTSIYSMQIKHAIFQNLQIVKSFLKRLLKQNENKYIRHLLNKFGFI